MGIEKEVKLMTFNEVWTKGEGLFSSKPILKRVARQKWIDEFNIKWVQFNKGIMVYKWNDDSFEKYDHSEDKEDDWVELT